jgi:hypothetical protein
MPTLQPSPRILSVSPHALSEIGRLSEQRDAEIDRLKLELRMAREQKSRVCADFVKLYEEMEQLRREVLTLRRLCHEMGRPVEWEDDGGRRDV